MRHDRKSSNLDALAARLLINARPDPPSLTGSSTAGGGSDIDTRITRLPTPIGDEDDVLTVVDDSGDLVPLWRPAASAIVAEIDDIGDVNAPTPANGDVLTWDSTPGEWINLPPAAGYTDEQARNAIGAALVAGDNIAITVDDPGDTITIAVIGRYRQPTHASYGGGAYLFNGAGDPIYTLADLE